MKRRRQSAWVRGADDGQWWQDLQAGHAASNVNSSDGDEYYAAMLYMPDPTSRSGWQLHGVAQPLPKDEPDKPMGFRR